MKRLLAASALALTVLAGSQQPASAWCNVKFGIGLNFECQTGNNCLLWGVYRNGQVPDGYGFMPPPPALVPGPSDFHAPAPTPVHSSIMPQYYPAPYTAPTSVASTPSYPTNAPASYTYPASYYPSYPATYYPMSYSYYGTYGSFSYGQ
jgi:hypothetical protein